MILTSSPFMILNERFNNSLHIYDLRNLSSEVTSVERYSQSQQVSLLFEISIRNLKFLFLLIINSFAQEMEKGMWLFLVLKEIWYLSRRFMVVCRILDVLQRLDAIPSAVFHPYNPLLVCGTGQRHYEEPIIPSCCLLYQIPWQYNSEQNVLVITNTDTSKGIQKDYLLLNNVLRGCTNHSLHRAKARLECLQFQIAY